MTSMGIVLRRTVVVLLVVAVATLPQARIAFAQQEVSNAPEAVRVVGTVEEPVADVQKASSLARTLELLRAPGVWHPELAELFDFAAAGEPESSLAPTAASTAAIGTGWKIAIYAAVAFVAVMAVFLLINEAGR